MAELPRDAMLSAEEVAALRAIGDNTGCMALKGASVEHRGAPKPDRWELTEGLSALAARRGIAPERDLVKTELSPAPG